MVSADVLYFDHIHATDHLAKTVWSYHHRGLDFHHFYATDDLAWKRSVGVYWNIILYGWYRIDYHWYLDQNWPWQGLHDCKVWRILILKTKSESFDLSFVLPDGFATASFRSPVWIIKLLITMVEKRSHCSKLLLHGVKKFSTARAHI